MRRKYVYTQKIRIRALHTNGKLAREEQTIYTVVPSKEGDKKQLISLKGRFAERGSLEPYAGESDAPAKGVGSEIDKALVRALRDGLLNDEHSKDGIAKDLFPLTSSEIVKYRFTLLGEEQYRGHKALRIAFLPKPRDKKKSGSDENCEDDCAS